MDWENALQAARIFSTADGGCTICATEQAALAAGCWPEWDWKKLVRFFLEEQWEDEPRDPSELRPEDFRAE